MRGSITGTFAMTMHVHDLGKGSKFWEALGLKQLHSDADTTSFVVPGSGPLTLHRWQTACETNGGRPPGTVTGLMLTVDDATAATERIRNAGGTIIAPPFPAPTGGHWAVVADPDGNEFIVCAAG